jgi:N utilization substance protein A
MKITFNTETIRLITLFENMTGASVRDCLVDEEANIVYFIIEEGEMGIAIGRNGSSVRNVEKIIGKSIKLFEFSKDINKFVRMLIPQVTEIKIRNDGGKSTLEIKIGKRDKAVVLGRDRKNIKLFKEIIQRNHDIDDLVVR